MKFTVKHEFKHGFNTYEVGNSHDSDNLDDVSDADVNMFYSAGWADIEGQEPGPEAKPIGAELEVQNVKHNVTAADVGEVK